VKPVWELKRLGTVLKQRTEECRITDPNQERFVTVRLYGKGAVPRKIGDGKTPIMEKGWRLRSGDLIYSRIDARNGAFALVSEDLAGAVVSKDFPSFEIDRNRINPGYLIAYLGTEAFFGQLRASSFGTTNRQRITEAVLLSYTIPLPPLSEQERIVRLLDAAEGLRRLREEADRRTADLIPAVFHEMFGDQGGNASHVQMLPLEEALDFVNGRAFKSTDWSDVGLPIIRIQNLKDPAAPFNHFQGAFEERHRVEEGDLLLSWAGQLVSFGVHVWRRPPGVLNQHIFKITPKVRFEIAFLEQALSHIVEHAKHGFHGIEMKHITKAALSKYQMPYPPIELQRQFAVRVAQVRALEAQQAAARRLLDDLFQSLLHRAFRGDL
jgi:type I restriction enzyme S subunit